MAGVLIPRDGTKSASMQGLNRYFLVDLVRAGTKVHVILLSLSNVGTRVIQCLFVVS